MLSITSNLLKCSKTANWRLLTPLQRSFSQFHGYETDETFNITPSIDAKIGKQLYLKPSHPVNIIKVTIENYFKSLKTAQFKCIDGLSPIVSTYQAFDSVLVPKDHVSRSLNDTFYVNKNTVLRPHTTAHEVELLKQGYEAFTCTGDCYRRDTIDNRHYPVFTQMEAMRLFDKSTSTEDIVNDLKSTVEGMVQCIFPKIEMRWNNESFPFTNHSLELEIHYNNQWIEVLGCGKSEDQVLLNGERPDKQGWALGFGLDRLAMILFNIPDIRLLWSEDERFSNQFKGFEQGIDYQHHTKIPQFVPFSKYPICFKDISFYLPEGQTVETFSENTFCSFVREYTEDMVESIELKDSFFNKKKNRTSLCYRINYRSLSRNLTNQEIDVLQNRVREELTKHMNVQLR